MSVEYTSTFQIVKDYWADGLEYWELCLLMRNAGWATSPDMMDRYSRLELLSLFFGSFSSEEKMLKCYNETFDQLSIADVTWAKNFAKTTEWRFS